MLAAQTEVPRCKHAANIHLKEHLTPDHSALQIPASVALWLEASTLQSSHSLSGAHRFAQLHKRREGVTACACREILVVVLLLFRKLLDTGKLLVRGEALPEVLLPPAPCSTRWRRSVPEAPSPRRHVNLRYTAQSFSWFCTFISAFYFSL